MSEIIVITAVIRGAQADQLSHQHEAKFQLDQEFMSLAALVYCAEACKGIPYLSCQRGKLLVAEITGECVLAMWLRRV